MFGLEVVAVGEVVQPVPDFRFDLDVPVSVHMLDCIDSRMYRQVLASSQDPNRCQGVLAVQPVCGGHDLQGWPAGLRIIVRREPAHPQYARDLKPYEVATGYRYQPTPTHPPSRPLHRRTRDGDAPGRRPATRPREWSPTPPSTTRGPPTLPNPITPPQETVGTGTPQRPPQAGART